MFTVKREKATWVRWDSRRMKVVTSHPMLYFVYENGKEVKAFDTRREADRWITVYSD